MSGGGARANARSRIASHPFPKYAVTHRALAGRPDTDGPPSKNPLWRTRVTRGQWSVCVG